MSETSPLSSIPGIGFPALPRPAVSTQLALQFQLEQSQWWTAERLREAQFEQLAPLLRHAATTVPFYRDLFAAHQLTPPEKLDPTFWARIPITRRADLQAAGDHWLSSQPPREHGPVTFGTTSGSTGRAVRFGRTPAYAALWQAFALRDHLWQNRDFRLKLSAIRWLPRGEAEAPAGQAAPDWGPPVSGVFPCGPFSILNVVATLPEQLAWLRRERPDYLASFPSNLRALVRHAHRVGETLPPVRLIRTIGETVTPELRREVSETWGAPLADIYTCEEAGYLAIQCPGTDHYHVQSENVLLEIVDDAGQPCPPGVSGRVLVTSLNNYVTPLVRYEIGDYAEFGEPCACGRGLPVLRRILGRRRNRLHLPSGENVFPFLGEHGQILALTGVRVREFQCIQHDLRRVEVKLVADRSFTPEEEARVAAQMRANLGHPFEVFYTFHAHIERGPRGKFEEFISLVEG
jgi:phenylacetate-CoA ligase